MKRTYQPKKRQRLKEHGFRKRMATANGRKVLKRRRARGRKSLTAQFQDQVSQVRDNSELTLRKQKDFSRVYNKGKSRGSKYVVVLYRNNNLDYSRTAFVSSKKVGNSVERNRSRRLMRESFYSIRDNIKEGYDIIFVARNSINGTDMKEVQRSMFGTVRACGLFK